jgi:flagellar hook-basal body complex protein FliE
MADALSDVSQTQDEARSTIEAFVRGDREVTIHELMAASEEASLSLELLVEMRNKLTEAYRSIMNMQT